MLFGIYFVVIRNHAVNIPWWLVKTFSSFEKLLFLAWSWFFAFFCFCLRRFFTIFLFKIEVFYYFLHFSHNICFAKDVFAFFLAIFTLVWRSLNHNFSGILSRNLRHIFFIYIDGSVIIHDSKLVCTRLKCFFFCFSISRNVLHLLHYWFNPTHNFRSSSFKEGHGLIIVKT